MTVGISAELPSEPLTLDIKEKPVSGKKKVLAKIWNVVSKILLGIANAGLFLANPTIYSIAFLAGVIWPGKVGKVVDKIKMIWKKQPWAMAAVTGVAGFLALQVTFATASALFAAHLGAKLSQKAQDYMDQEKASHKEQKTFKLI